MPPLTQHIGYLSTLSIILVEPPLLVLPVLLGSGIFNALISANDEAAAADNMIPIRR